VERDAQATPGVGKFTPLSSKPPPIELIVAVQSEFVIKTREHGFAAGIDGLNHRSLKPFFKRLKLGKSKARLLDWPTDENLRDPVCRAADFRPFRHRSAAYPGNAGSNI